MARKLKTFITSIGFYDLAVAAPSMKAALEAWGVQRNLFQQGTAWETDDPAIQRATLAKPGLVLKRVVGSNEAFAETAELPKVLPSAGKPAARKAKDVKARPKAAEPRQAAQAHKAAVIQFEREKAKRDAQRAAQEAEEERERKSQEREAARRSASLARAQEALDEARQRHEKALAELARQRAALDRKEDQEKERWGREEERLQKRVREAGD